MNIEEIRPVNTPGINPGSNDRSTAGWFSWTRPQSYGDVICAHLPWLLAAGIPLLLSFLVPLQLLPMIPCTFLRLTGYPCPFCGFTRSFWDISQGAWSDALLNCPLGGLLYVFVISVFIWNVPGLLGGIIVKPGTILALNRRKVGLISTLFLINWMYRLSMGFS